MPVGKSPGQNVSSVKKKEDVSEKVREIKQRQQNWLVQREQSKNTDNGHLKSKLVSSHPNKVTTAGSFSSKSSMASSFHTNVKPTRNDQGRKKVTDTFNNWRKAREHNVPEVDHDAISICSGAESELERLVSPDLDISKDPIAEDEFGDLADKIAHRVKQDMGISKSYASSEYEVTKRSATETDSDHLSLRSSGSKTYTKNATYSNQVRNSGLTSHHCPVCNTLMFSSSHVPMMIIPCGHTLCKACSDKLTHCPDCSCSIISLTVNIMLRQVIQEYHHTQNSLTSPTTTSQTSDKTHPSTEDHRTKTVCYKSQLANLQMRQSVLSEEHSSLADKNRKLASQIQHVSTQTKSIIEQEHEVKKAIVDLQDRLSALETHRKQYETQLTDLHDEKSETEGKITLLSGTLSSLSRELEKVKLLAEGD